MITRQVIETLYKKYRKAPKSIDMLNLSILFEYAAQHHNIFIDPEAETLLIGSIDPASPFHTIYISRINAIVAFEEWVAIVLPASIIFLNRTNNKVAIDIRSVRPSLLDRLLGIDAKPDADIPEVKFSDPVSGLTNN